MMLEIAPLDCNRPMRTPTVGAAHAVLQRHRECAREQCLRRRVALLVLVESGDYVLSTVAPSWG